MKTKWLRRGLGTALCAIVSLPAISNAGTVTGTVVYEGRAPQMRPIPTAADPKCDAMHKDEPLRTEFLVLGEGQTMANVLVHVKQGLPDAEYPVPEEEFVLTQHGCMYAPHIVAMRAGQTLKVLNPDGILHNIHFLPKVNTEFNKSMPENRPEITHVFPKAEPVFEIKCDVHPWMAAFCALFDHPYFAVTNEAGEYAIEGVPAGDYTLEFWHEKLGTREATITITEDGDATADATFSLQR